MKLLDLKDGKASLELNPDEVAAVLDRLREYGATSMRTEATYCDVTVGAQSFVYLDEWDQPCLISTTAIGTAMLAEIAYGPTPRQSVAG